MDKIAGILLIALLALVFAVSLSYYILSQPNQPSNNSLPTPVPTSEQFVVTSVTANPSNATPGLVSVIAEVRNDGTQNETLLVIMQIKEPNGDIMSIANDSSPLSIPAGESKTITFEPRIPLNVKIGQFNVNINVYDLNQTIKLFNRFHLPLHNAHQIYFPFRPCGKNLFQYEG